LAGIRELSDSGGLYLEASPSDGKYWRWKYRFAGKEKRLAFGVYPDVTLKMARKKRDSARQRVKAQTGRLFYERQTGK